MEEATLRKTLALFALLSLPVGAYFLVLYGGVPISYDAGVILTAVAGTVTIGAVTVHEKIPAITAGFATIGFGLGVMMSGFAVTVAAGLVVLGSVGFLVSTAYSIGTHTYGNSTV